MNLHMPTVIVTLIVSAAIFFSAAMAFLPENTAIETVERELTAEQETAVECHELLNFWWDTPEDSVAEDAAFEKVMDVCLP